MPATKVQSHSESMREGREISANFAEVLEAAKVQPTGQVSAKSNPQDR